MRSNLLADRFEKPPFSHLWRHAGSQGIIALFFKLADFEAMLKEWIVSGPIQPQMANKLNEWFEAGLQEWDTAMRRIGGLKSLMRLALFYVWLDAPIKQAWPVFRIIATAPVYSSTISESR